MAVKKSPPKVNKVPQRKVYVDRSMYVSAIIEPQKQLMKNDEEIGAKHETIINDFILVHKTSSIETLNNF